MKALVLLLLIGCGRGPAPCSPRAGDADRSNTDKRCVERR